MLEKHPDGAFAPGLVALCFLAAAMSVRPAVAAQAPEPAVASQAGAAPSAKPSAGAQIDSRVRNDVVDTLARQLDSKYAIAEVAHRLAAALREKKSANAYRNISSAPEFARALTEDLYAVAHDKHLRVNYEFTASPKGPAAPPPPGTPAERRRLNGGIPEVKILDGNVGYMKLYAVLPIDLAHNAVAAAFAFVHDSDALIIDNRDNGGGDPKTVALYVSYLSEGKPFVVNTFHWRADNRVEEFKTTDLGELSYGLRKPVFVLTSPGTFSGGEELTYDLQVLKRAVTVGEVTGGGANPGGPLQLGHGFVVNLPGGQAVNPVTGTSWEGVGVKPDVPVAAAAALARAHTLAIERLRAATTDVATDIMLDAVAMKLQVLEEAQSGTAHRLKNADVVGDYRPQVGTGSTVRIFDQDGRLVRHVDGLPDRELIYLSGNRYRPAGTPEGFAISFRVDGDKTELLLEEPMWPSTIRVKQ
jgi:retinol-binding protein 3